MERLEPLPDPRHGAVVALGALEEEPSEGWRVEGRVARGDGHVFPLEGREPRPPASEGAQVRGLVRDAAARGWDDGAVRGVVRRGRRHGGLLDDLLDPAEDPDDEGPARDLEEALVPPHPRAQPACEHEA